MRALRPLLILLFFPAQHISAEYRAYELRISNKEKKIEKHIVSTFDHIQYSDYHTLGPGESVEYIDSWMCWERTGDFKPPCPNPKKEALRVPSNDNKVNP